MLTSKFENIRMNENQSFSTFYLELSDIVNFSFNLGEPIPDFKVVRKILRSLPERFRPKVTAIEESKNIDSLRIDELVGSIQTYEMTLPTSHKHKETVFKASEKEEKESHKSEDISKDELANMARKLGKVLKSNKKIIKNFNTEKMRETGKPSKDIRK